MHGTCVQILFGGGGVSRAFSYLHRKMSDRSVCNFAGLIKTSENV